MSIDTNGLRSLPVAEKLRIVEMLWDDLGDSTEPIPLPDWVTREVNRRREEMRDPLFGISHEETWRRIDGKLLPPPTKCKISPNTDNAQH